MKTPENLCFGFTVVFCIPISKLTACKKSLKQSNEMGLLLLEQDYMLYIDIRCFQEVQINFQKTSCENNHTPLFTCTIYYESNN